MHGSVHGCMAWCMGGGVVDDVVGDVEWGWLVTCRYWDYMILLLDFVNYLKND